MQNVTVYVQAFKSSKHYLMLDITVSCFFTYSKF